MNPAPSDPPSNRNVDEGPSQFDHGDQPPYGKSWAALIGINDYKHHRKLRFAAADAVGMAHALIEYQGFLPEHVFLIISTADPLPPELAAWLTSIKPQLGGFDERATKEAIEGLLFTTLRKRTGPNDCVLIYFAGHGTPLREDDDKLEDLRPYLVTADAHDAEWHMHIEMDALERQGQTLPAKHVFYVFDACFAGLFGHRSNDITDRSLRDRLLRKARQCLTAGTAEEYVNDRGYEGHSVFTWHLLQALRESSDRGPIPVSTLATEIKKRVGDDSLSEQTPDAFTLRGHRGGDFVFLGRKRQPSPDDIAELARLLIDHVGRPLDERSPIEFAAVLWQRIGSLDSVAAEHRTRAWREHGRSLLLLGRTEAALQEVSRGELSRDANAMLLRAMAQLRLGRMSDAAQQLATLAGAASGHAYAGWASRAAEVARQPRGKRYALLIGVDEVKSLHEQLAAVRHDIAAMKRLFESVLEFEPGNVTVLVGRDATRGAIEAAFQHHVRATGPEDSFVCYFSGKGLLNRGVAVYSSYDVDLSAGIQWTEHDCDSAMRSIAARDKLLITDGCHLAPTSLDERAYRFLFGCRRDEMGWEEHDADGTPRGVFTSALERAVHALGNASVERIVAHVTAGLTGGQLPPQTPGYTGSGSSHLIDRRHASLELIELAEQSHRRFSAEQLDDFTYWLAKDQGRSASMAPLWLAVGHARLAKHSYEAAIDAFERSRHPAAWLPLVRAELCCGRYAAAFLHWRQWHADHAQSMSDTGAAMLASDLQALLEHIHASTRRALIVVTDLDGDRELLQQVSLLQRALKDRWSMRPGDIKLVMNASKDAVLADFEGFARAAGEAPALFLFVGPGFDGPELWLSTAGQADLLADLCLAELRERATGCLNLTSAIVLTKICSPIHDAPLPGWSTPARPPPLGRGTLVAVPHDHREFDVPATPPDLAGLVGALTTPGKFPFTLKDWLGRVRPAHGLSIRGNGDAALLSYHEAGNRALELVRDIEQLPLHRLLALLAGLADHAEFGDDARLHLAIIRWQLGRHKDALGDVDVVLKRQQSTATPGVDAQGPSATARRSEAHYWHGRILLDLRRFAEAEHEFAIVVQLDPEHARAHRHRAEAIQRLIETDLERLLQDSIQHYLRLGAPLGMDDELLQRRTPARAK